MIALVTPGSRGLRWIGSGPQTVLPAPLMSAGPVRGTPLNVTLKQLEILHAIVLAGSISQATRTVGLSQPTLSQQLAKFEEMLGTQLIVRGRSTAIRLTAAGEFWFRNAAEILGAMEKASQQHRVLFDDRNLTLRFGTTPSLRGRFIEVTAQAALELDQLARFEFVWAMTSSDVVEMIHAHKLNCGVVSAASIAGHQASFHVEQLWRDPVVWVVPATIPTAAIIDTLATGNAPGPAHQALTRYVDLTTNVPWKDWSGNWYRHRLPFATPFFGCMTHQAAVDIVAAGLATCHTPMSLLRNLPATVLDRLKVVELNEHARDVVLVIPRHLLSLKPFRTFCDKICHFTRANYREEFSGNGQGPEVIRAADLPAAGCVTSRQTGA